MSKSVITQNGLNFVTSAFNHGTLIAIKYWVPMYDYRIDPTIRNGEPLSAISAVMIETSSSVNLSKPIGEPIWNIQNAYKLSDQTFNKYILSGLPGEVFISPVLSNSKQISYVPINLNASTNIPLSNHYGGSSVVVSAGTDVASWTFTDVSAINGVNQDYFADKTKMFPVIDYMPVREPGQIALKGKFFCRLSENIGTVKFNKIALYASQYYGNTEINFGFFGEAYLETPIKKSFFGDGFNLITFEVLLTLSATGGDNNIWYGASADYWSKVPNGMHSSEKISIGDFEYINSEPQAIVHIGRIKKSDGTYDNKPHIRLDATSGTSNFSVDIVAYQTLGGPYIGQNVLSLSANTDLYILPKQKTYFGYYNNTLYGIVFSGTNYPNDDHINYTLLNTKEDYLQLKRHTLQFYDNGDPTCDNNVVYGADIVRNLADLLIQTRYKNIYILAGARNFASPLEQNYNSWQRHVYNISDVQNETPLSSTDNWIFSANAFIVARGGIRVFGPLELNYIPKSLNSWPYASNWGLLSSKKKYLGIMAGLKLNETYFPVSAGGYASQYDYLLHESINNTTTWNPIGEYLDSNSILFLQAGRIKTWGNIEPGINLAFDIGNNLKRYKDLYIQKIDVRGLFSNNESKVYYSHIHGVEIESIYSQNIGPYVYRTTKLYPDNKSSHYVDTIWIGTETLPIDYINANSINVPNKFLADNNGVYAFSLSANNVRFYNGIYEANRDTKLGEWKEITNNVTALLNNTASACTINSAYITEVGRTCIFRCSFYVPLSASGFINYIRVTISNMSIGSGADQLWWIDYNGNYYIGSSSVSGNSIILKILHPKDAAIPQGCSCSFQFIFSY